MLDGYTYAGPWRVNNPKTLLRLSLLSMPTFVMFMWVLMLWFNHVGIPVHFAGTNPFTTTVLLLAGALSTVLLHELCHMIVGRRLSGDARLFFHMPYGPYVAVPGVFGWAEAALLNLAPMLVLSPALLLLGAAMPNVSSWMVMFAAMNIAISLSDIANSIEFVFLPKGAVAVSGHGELDGLWIPESSR